MSFGASLIHAVYRLSGVKKLYSLPEDELLKAIEKANRGRGFFLPADHKAYYEKKMIGDFPCLIVRAAETPAKRAILFCFGGGMVIGPDKGDAAVLRKLCFGTDSDVWFPMYPLCTEHCITESYAMAFECYYREAKEDFARIIEQLNTLGGDGNVRNRTFGRSGPRRAAVSGLRGRHPERRSRHGASLRAQGAGALHLAWPDDAGEDQTESGDG